MRKMRALLATPLLLVACSGGERFDDGPDASSTEASAPTAVTGSTHAPLAAPATRADRLDNVARARAMLARSTVAGDLLAPNDELARVGDSFQSSVFRAASRDVSRMGGIVPALANEPIRVGAGRLDKWSAKIQLVGAGSVVAQEDAGRIEFDDAYPSTKIFVTGRARELEVFYLLENASAPTTFRWKLELGSDLKPAAAPLPDGSIDLLDAQAMAALRIHAAWAVDAKGRRRAVPLKLTDGELTIALDASGLEYPILLDPDLSVPVWQLRESLGTSLGRVDPGVAWSSALGKVVLAGGHSGSWSGTHLSTFAWGGSSWSSTGNLPAAAIVADPAMGSLGTGVLTYGGATSDNVDTAAAYSFNGSTWTTACAACGPGPMRGSRLARVTGGALLAGGQNVTSFTTFNAVQETVDVRPGACGVSFGTLPFMKMWFVPDGTPSSFSVRPVTASGICTDLSDNPYPQYFSYDGPEPRFDHAFAGDGGDNALLFGGTLAKVGSLRDRDLADTWLYHPSTGLWEEICGVTKVCADAPSPRSLAGLTWDSVRKRFVLFSGKQRLVSGSLATLDTWEFDLASRRWSRACASCGPANVASIAFDPSRRRVVAPVAYRTETWEYYVRANACASNAECDTGVCWEGICCESACPTCQTCTDPSSPGECKPVAAGGKDPLSRCLVEDVSGDWVPGQCSGTGACKQAAGSTCATGADCASGNCVDSTCCATASCGVGLTCANASGACKKQLGGSCVSNGECSAGNCVDGVCCGTSSCAPGQKCNYPSALGQCRRDNAQTCTSAAQCGSGNCVDGVCCNAPCTEQCAACNVVPGTCTPVTGAPRGARTTCPGSGDCRAQCNGSDVSACKYPGAAISCGTSSCSAGTAKSPGTCDGAGACNQPGASCGAYACDTTTCRTTCSADTHCASGYYCKASACTVKEPAGTACTSGSTCASGNCVDAVCCSSPSCALGSSCNGATSKGSCTKSKGQTCVAATECGTGFCVDGTCCESACAGQCQACNVAPYLGTCSTVVGAPVGARAACGGTGAGTACGMRCDGTTASACTYPGSASSCGTASCTSGVAKTPGTCDGAGVCSQPSSSCGAYACDTAVCRTTCTVDANCASGYYCKAGACAVKESNGTTCTTASHCASGNCVDAVCCSAASCATGASCNGATAKGVCTKDNGETCASAAECGSGFCVDGTCCDSACAGQCQACNLATAPGKCGTVSGPPVGSRASCGGVGAGTACGKRCNGVDPAACNYPESSTSCGTPSCTGGVETGSSTCDGGGACKPSSKSCGAYTCGTTTCKTTCVANAECASGYYCKAGACAAKEPDGATCTAGGAAVCASGNCVDGACCATASCSSGLRCNVAGVAGKCAKPNGVACTSSGECGSGSCVDGVCCDTACSGQCQACDVSGSIGTCTTVSGKPHGARSACAGAGSGSECGPACDGADATACKYPGTSKTCGAKTCGAGSETHVSACNGAGACGDEPTACGGYVCDTDACKRSCGANSDCTTGYYCKSGACIPIEGLGTTCTTATTCTSGFCTDGVCCAVGSCGVGKSCGAGLTKGVCSSLNGTTCKADGECASGKCVDGVCCDSQCSGSCEACNVGGSLGKCVPVVGDPRTGHPPCSGTASDPRCGLSCDGSDGKTCKYAAATVSCGAPSCAAGVETQVSSCDGGGACKPANKTCGTYACGPKACLSSCTVNADCASGSYCKAGACTPVELEGKVCTANAECRSGFCTDGVCCKVSSCGEGAACAGSETAKPGDCLLKRSVACSGPSDCASGHCVDGVCCESACSGQCEACDVVGSEGKCTPVVGAPHRARATCDTREASDCARQSCDGIARDKCVGFANGATTACGKEECTADRRLQKKGACDGKGGCAVPEASSCVEYACDPAKVACFSSCESDEQCGPDFTCEKESKKCIQGARCSADRTESIDKTGTPTRCAPYKCGTDGKCQKLCATSDDCIAGTVCDTSTNACTGVAPEAGGEGGCGCATPGSTRNDLRIAVVGLVALAAGIARRRRDRRTSPPSR